MLNTKPKDESAGVKELLFASLRGTLIGIAATLLSSLIMTAVALMTKDPEGLIGIFALASLVVGSLLGGITANKADTEQRLGSSLVSGGGYVIILWLVSLFFRADTPEPTSPLLAVVVYLGCIAVSLLGGIVARPKQTRIKEGKSNAAARLRRQLGKRT